MFGVDKQGEILIGPYQVAIDITNKCNYRCLHCYNASGENNSVNDELTNIELENFIRDINKMNLYNVCFCGGEPLLKKDLIYKSADLLHSNSFTKISMVSNGYFLTDQVAQDLKKHGINSIQISLDGATPERCFELRQNKLAFDKAVSAIQSLAKAGYKDYTISFCPTKNNIFDFEDVWNLCMKLGVRQIRVQPLMVIGRANKNVELLVPSKDQYVRLLKKIDELNRKYKNVGGLSIEWGDPIDHIFRYSSGMTNINMYISIKSNGGISVSPYLPLIVGNIKRHSFKEYWDSGLYKVWELDIVKKMAKKITCIADMGKQMENVGFTWFDKDVEIDLIDDKLFKK